MVRRNDTVPVSNFNRAGNIRTFFMHERTWPFAVRAVLSKGNSRAPFLFLGEYQKEGNSRPIDPFGIEKVCVDYFWGRVLSSLK